MTFSTLPSDPDFPYQTSFCLNPRLVAVQIGHTHYFSFPWLVLFSLSRIPAVGVNPSSHPQPQEIVLYRHLRDSSYSSQTEFFNPFYLYFISIYHIKVN